MKPSYDDITTKLGPALWWDENGVPRYVEFHPHHASNIYAREVVLLEIGCQGCTERMLVEMNGGIYGTDMAMAVKDHRIHYGDPPSHGDHAGETMNSIPLRVVQFWSRVGSRMEWKRVPELEIVIQEPDAP